MFRHWRSTKVFVLMTNVDFTLFSQFELGIFFSDWSEYSYDHTNCLHHLCVLYVCCKFYFASFSFHSPVIIISKLKLFRIFLFLGWTKSCGMLLVNELQTKIINCCVISMLKSTRYGQMSFRLFRCLVL